MVRASPLAPAAARWAIARQCGGRTTHEPRDFSPPRGALEAAPVSFPQHNQPAAASPRVPPADAARPRCHRLPAAFFKPSCTK